MSIPTEPTIIHHTPFVFLDRDGVINYNSPDYIKNWTEFEFIPGSLDAISLLTRNGFQIIIITNQSMINRHISPLENLETIFINMLQAIEANGGKIADIYYCPHTPAEKCNCRKPQIGMLEAVRKKYNPNFSKAYFIGDSVTDIMCAQNAQCGYPILVKTGNGLKAKAIMEKSGLRPAFIARNLYDAAQWIVQNSVKIPRSKGK